MNAASPAVPVSDRIAWGCLGVAAAGLVAGLAQYWQANPGHADRLLVLAAAVWSAVRLRPFAAAVPVRPRPWVGLAMVVVGAAALPAAVYLHARVGGRTLLLWWQAASVLVAASGLIVARHGWPRLRLLGFPLLFPLFALPLPTAVEAPLQGWLKELTTTLSAAGLEVFGLSVRRSGFVLHLESGDLGVAEACSGIRSLTALTALAGFVAFLRGFGPVRTAVLLTLTVPVVLAVNVARVVLTGLIQTYVGSRYAEGNWHEALGLAAVLVGLVLILGVARLLGPAAAFTPPPASPDGPSARRRGKGVGWAAAGVLVAATVGGLAAAAAGWSALNAAAATAPLEELPLALGNWRGEPRPIPDVVAEMLVYDNAIYRVYTDNLGQEGHVWVVFWTAASVQKGYHSPEVCWPARGFEITHRWTQPVGTPDGATVPATGWEFRRDKECQYVIHWVQDGPEVPVAEDQRPRSGQSWVTEFLTGSENGPEPRIMILVGIQSGTAVAKADAVKLGGLVAGEVYKICPWANPAVGR